MLVARAGQIISKDDLLEAGWKDVAVGDNSIEQAISSLRRLLGTPPGGDGGRSVHASVPARPEPTAAEVEATDAAERRAEIADLTRRVGIGAVLTAPVLLAVMADSLFNAGWVPGVLLNWWVQLALDGRSTASAG